MRHEAIRNLYANVITIDDDLGAFDANGIQVSLDEDIIAAEIERLRPIKLAEQVSSQRRVAYALEADPLFFKAQRGEATMDDWQAKVAEIKARYPKAQP
jgi:hypothetical protein